MYINDLDRLAFCENEAYRYVWHSRATQTNDLLNGAGPEDGCCFFFLFYTRLFEVKNNNRKKIYHYLGIAEIQLCVNNAWIVLLFFIS